MFSSRRKNAPMYDDRMFSAYIITKRSGSEYSSSEDENRINDDHDPVPLPSSSNSKSNDGASAMSNDGSRGVREEDVDSEDDSINPVSTFEPKKKDRKGLASSSVLKTRRKFSWISSEDDSSGSEETAWRTKGESISFLKSLSSKHYVF